MDDIDLLSINTIRTLAIDAVQKANSGHPGTPMGMAPLAYTVWQDYLRYDPAQPLWPNRDRFILSPGHASMLIYSILHLTKVQAVDENEEVLNRPAVGMEDLKSFRQPGSVTPGHPEYRHTAGVEATTGPLGQGVSMSVGMAIAEKWLAAHYNRPDHTIIDYNIYTLCSDGDMMEGVASEAASLAAHLKLDNLCWIYNSNCVTLDGPSSWTFSENVGARFLAYGWNVLAVRDGNDIAEIKVALDSFLQERSRPTLIVVDTHIGYGSPNKQDSNASHGEPLGAEEVRLTKKPTAGRKKRSSWSLSASMRILRTGSGSAARRSARSGARTSGSTCRPFGGLVRSSRRCSKGLSPKQPRQQSPSSQPTPRVWPAAIPPAKSRMS